MAPTPATWFLPFWASSPTLFNGDGRPWGDGTAMAARANPPSRDPWDEGCRVTSYVKSLDAMSDMRDSLEALIAAAAGSGQPVGQRGYVYMAGWRLNPLRDVSTTNPWTTNPWDGYVVSTNPAVRDQTVVGLVVRLLQAGVRVRVLVWLPNSYMERTPADLAAHVEEHRWIARVVASETDRLTPTPADPLGVVALDLRTSDPGLSPAHHQKMMVIRSPTVNVAYVGGVDLAYTRRDAPSLSGDWEAGAGIPAPATEWPRAATGVDYGFLGRVPMFGRRQASDLPANVYGNSTPPLPGDRQMWHDHHLKLEGPVVRTIEEQFAERWRDSGRVFDLSNDANFRGGQVIFSTDRAFTSSGIVALPIGAAVPAVPGASSRVQMWRTIPLRLRTRTGPPFVRGEFTVAAGVAQAVVASRELIWIFDQYFWSRPFARLVNRQLRDAQRPNLNVIVVLPPHADTVFNIAHWARAQALDALVAGLSSAQLARVAVYDMWLDPTIPTSGGRNRGIYVHAKSHTYDNDLLVTGSANINRRSFLGDTELACAVLDTAVVTSHQDRLWQLLFNASRPALDLDQPGTGAQFMAAFRAAAAATGSHLIPDPWRATPPTLPNTVVRDDRMGIADESLYDNILESSSITSAVESNVRTGFLASRPAHLGDVVFRLEHDWSGGRLRYRR